MKKTLLFLIIFTSTMCVAQPDIKVYFEQVENGYNIYADNNEYSPVSIKVDFTALNLNIEGGNNNVYVVEPRKDKQLLTTLTVAKKGKAYKFSYTTWTNVGNHNSDIYDEDYAYYLPYNTANTYKIYQGYNGSFSHQNENSLDFLMPIGTEVTAVREGTVVKVVENNSKSCEKKECVKYNNQIIIYHPDGTFAEYTHIKQNGAVVNVGDKVKKGQKIAYSGNTGWSTGPHLHLVVYLQKLRERQTLKTKFKTGNGDTLEYLEEKKEYTRSY